MPQKRARAGARQHGGVRDGLEDLVPAVTAVEKRGIVTSYITLTPDSWTGQLTTILPSASADEDDSPGKVQGKKITDGDSTSSLPSAILAPSGSTTDTVDPTAPLIAQSPEPTTPTPEPTSIMPSTTVASSTSDTTAAASTTAAAVSSSDSGSDAAAKAGIALGVLGGLFVVLALVYIIIRRRRKQIEEQQRMAADDEKLNGPFEERSPASSARAPRLSLRPMTGLFTSLNAASQGGQQTAGSSSIALVAGPTGKRIPGTSAWERPSASETDSAYSDPFGSSAERLPDDPGTPKKPMSPIMETSPQARFVERGGPGLAPRVSALTSVSAATMDSATLPSILTRELPPSPKEAAEVSPIGSDEVPVGSAFSSPVPTPAASFTASSKAAAAALTAMERQPSERRQSVRKENVPAPLDLTLPPKMPAVPPSPSGTEFSFHEVDPEQSPIPSASAAAIAAAGGPANSTVHRVQLDFNPTLDDEMELQAGQLVRLLHEYDDGWVSGCSKALL